MEVSIEVIRNRAELARQIAMQLHEGAARKELLQIADDLDAEAAKLEAGQSNVTPIRPE